MPIDPKLTVSERNAILRGGHPAIVRAEKTFQKGEVIPLKSIGSEAGPVPVVSITCLSLKKGKKGEQVLEYSVRDDRGVHQGRNGYVYDSRFAVKAQDSQEAATLDKVSYADQTDQQKNLGSPPEPELVEPEEIGSLKFSMEARLRHREEKAKERAERNARADAKRLASRIRDTALRASRLGEDPTLFLAGIEQQIRAQEVACEEAA